MIEAGETTGTTTLMVVDDDLPDGGTGTNRVEALVLLGSVDGVEIGELTFIIWDAAVPALPVGGALLILLGGVEVDCGFVGRTGPEVETPARGRLARPNGEKAPAGAFSHKRGCRRCPVGEALLLGGRCCCGVARCGRAAGTTVDVSLYASLDVAVLALGGRSSPSPRRGSSMAWRMRSVLSTRRDGPAQAAAGLRTGGRRVRCRAQRGNGPARTAPPPPRWAGEAGYHSSPLLCCFPKVVQRGRGVAAR